MTLIGAWIAFWFIILKLMTLGAFFPVFGGMRTMRVPLQRNVIDAFQQLTYSGANAVVQTDTLYIPYSAYITAVRCISSTSSAPSHSFGISHEVKFGDDQVPYMGSGSFYTMVGDTWGTALSNVVTVYNTATVRKAYIMRTSEDRIFWERKCRKKIGADSILRLTTAIQPLSGATATSGVFEFDWEIDLVIGSYEFEHNDLEPPRLYCMLRTNQASSTLSHSIPVPSKGYFCDMRLYALNETGTEAGSIVVDKNLQDYDIIADHDTDIYLRRKPHLEIPFVTDLTSVYESSTKYNGKKLYVDKTDNLTMMLSNPSGDVLFVLLEATFVPFVGETISVKRKSLDMTSVSESTNFGANSRDVYSMCKSRLVAISGTYHITAAAISSGKLIMRNWNPSGYVQRSEITNIYGENAVSPANQQAYHIITDLDVIEIPFFVQAAGESKQANFAKQVNFPVKAEHRFAWDLGLNIGSMPSTFALDIEFLFVIEDRFSFKGGDFMEGYLLRNYNTEVVE